MRQHHEELTLLGQIGPHLAVAAGAAGAAATAVVLRIRKATLKGK